MEPFSWLLLKLTCLRLGRLRLGIGPVRELFWRFKEVRNVKFCMVFGMLPVKELKERSRTLSCGGRDEGILPEKSLCWRYT
jgi:hypothetical protein